MYIVRPYGAFIRSDCEMKRFIKSCLESAKSEIACGSVKRLCNEDRRLPYS